MPSSLKPRRRRSPRPRRSSSRRAAGRGLLLALLSIAPLAGEEAATSGLPSLEDLSRVSWRPRRCVFFLDGLREQLEKEGPPAVTEEEALALPNTGEEPNGKILGALGRLPRSDDEVDWDATFDRYIGADPNVLNPLFSSTRYDFWLEDLLFVGPLAMDWRFELAGDRNVIESWETSADNLMDRIVFRDDLKWSDGVPLTARDVEYTFQLISDPDIRCDARRMMAEGLRAVKAYDDRTVVYFHREALVTNSTAITFGILPRHAFEKARQINPKLVNGPLNRRPVTSGPYRLVHWRPKEEILLDRNDDWYQGPDGRRIRAKPFFRRVRFRVYPDSASGYNAFLAGNTDDFQLDSEQWVKRTGDRSFTSRGVKVRGDQEGNLAFIGWNALSDPPNPFFGDRRVRLAMTLALDHDFLLREVLFGLYRPGEGIYPPDSWMAARDLKPFHRDPKRAAALLDEAGWSDTDEDGVRDKTIDGKKVAFRFVLSLPSQGTGPKVARQLQSNLQDVGVQCDIQTMDFVAFKTLVQERKAQAFLQAMGQGIDPDTAANLWHTKAIENGRNTVGYSNPRVDELFEKGRREFDAARRAEIYAEIDRLIYEDQPITLLLYQPTLWAFDRSLRGYRPGTKGFYGYAPGFHSIWRKKGSDAPLRSPTAGLVVGVAAIVAFTALVWLVIRATTRSARRGP